MLKLGRPRGNRVKVGFKTQAWQRRPNKRAGQTDPEMAQPRARLGMQASRIPSPDVAPESPRSQGHRGCRALKMKTRFKEKKV